MANVGKIVARLRAVVEESPYKQGHMPPEERRVLVSIRDIETLLLDWTRLDERARLMYGPHHVCLSRAARDTQRALEALQMALNAIQSPENYRVIEQPARKRSNCASF